MFYVAKILDALNPAAEGLVIAQSQQDSVTMRIALPIITAILGFISSYTIERIRAKREPRRRISCHVTIDRALIAAGEDLRKDLEISYRGETVEDISSTRFRLQNTGTTVVKDQQVRISFPQSVRILEVYIDPKLPPEWRVERQRQYDLGESEALISVGHLERGNEVNIDIVASGPNSTEYTIVPFNQNGDVEFLTGDTLPVREVEDRKHIVPFITWLTLLIFLPRLVESFRVEEITDFVSTMIQAVCIGFLVIHLLPIARVVRDLTTRTQDIRSGDTTAHINGNVEHVTFESPIKNVTQNGNVEHQYMPDTADNKTERNNTSGQA
jgi:hypothetical protein